jgi:hypothetical protein
MTKENEVGFITKKLKSEYLLLGEGKFEDTQLFKFIQRAICDLKKDPTCGVKIPKDLWPKEYVKEYQITNLWKYDLPNGWRLVYTIETNEVLIVAIILEWFDHTNYERKFKY